MRIIHISDIHLENHGLPIWNTDTKLHFDKAIKKIQTMDNIDAIIISGDLSNDGSAWSYNYIDNLLAKTNIPTFCCPGNHDNLDIFYGSHKSWFYKNCELFMLNGWTFIMLNSVMAGKSRGNFYPDKFLDLLKHSCGPTVIVLHHPPIEQDGWLNRKLLENRDVFNDIIHKYKNIRLVLYGHTHHHEIKTIDGIIYSSASSIGFAFHPKLLKFQIAHGREGFSLITLNDSNIIIENIFI